MDAVVQVFFVRDGRLIGREHFYMMRVSGCEKEQILEDFVKQFYSGTPFIPREIMLQYEISDTSLIEEWLGKKKGGKVKLLVPKRGQRKNW